MISGWVHGHVEAVAQLRVCLARGHRCPRAPGSSGDCARTWSAPRPGCPSAAHRDVSRLARETPHRRCVGRHHRHRMSLRFSVPAGVDRNDPSPNREVRMQYGPWSLLTDVGLIGALLLAGTLVRRWVGVVQRLMLPASVIAGFLGLLLGPEGLAVLPFSGQLGTYASVLIAVIFACLALSDDMGLRGFGRSTAAFSSYSMAMYALQVGLGMVLAYLL